MIKRIGCILVIFAMFFCLSATNLAGVVATADDGENYPTISPKGGTLSSGTYRLTEDVTVASMLQVSQGAEVTIDLNGYTISSSCKTTILVNGAALNLIDSSAGTGGIVGTSTSSLSYVIKVQNSGTLNMYGGNISASYYGIYSDSSDCVINITAGTITSANRTAVYNDDGPVTVSGTDTVVISALGKSSYDAYGIYSYNSITISNPNAYISGSSGSVYKKGSITITAGHYSTDVSKYVPDGYICTETDDADYPYVVTAKVVEPEVVLPVLYGEALTLDGSTGVTYYFDMTDVSDPEAFTLVAKIGEDGTEKSISHGELKTLDDGITYYRYTVYVSPMNFSTTIYAYLTDGTNRTNTYEYSVYQYCMNFIDSEEESALCKAILNYGDYACTYIYETTFNSFGEIDDWTDPVTEEWDVDLEQYAAPNTYTEGVGRTLALDSSIYIVIYLTDDVVDEGDVFSVDGEVLEIHEMDEDGYSYYVEFPVAAKDMVNMYTVMKNDEELITYSVLTYVRNVVEAEDEGSALSNLCKAIYYYSTAASEYTGWQ